MLNRILRFKLVAGLGLAAILFVAGGWIWAYFTLRRIAQPLILHWNALIGINLVGGLSDLTVIGIFGLSITLVNFFIALTLEERDRFLGKLVAGATFFFGLLLFITFAAIIGVNS